MDNLALAYDFTGINKGLIELKKNIDINFRITKDVYFLDGIWDLNEFNKYDRDVKLYRFDFNSINEAFRLGAKLLVLHKKFRENKSFVTAHKDFEIIRAIANVLKDKNISDIRLLDTRTINEYFYFEKNHLTNYRKQTLARGLIGCLQMYQSYKKYDMAANIEFLEKVIKDHPDQRSMTVSYDYIPDEFLNQIVSLAVKDLDDVKVNRRDKIIAGLLIIMAETGMRLEEATLLEKGRLNTLRNGDKDIAFLDFYYYKNQEAFGGRRLTHTILTPVATKAYNELCKINEEIISGLDKRKLLRLMIKIKTGKVVKRSTTIEKMEEVVKQYTKNELEEINDKIGKYLFIDHKTGIKKNSPSVLRNNFEEFFIRHYSNFNLDDIIENEVVNIKSLRIQNESKYKKIFSVEEREKISYKEVFNLSYPYVNPHMFRVTVCTKLFRKNIHLDYIVKHMNHLSEDMSMYYNKSAEYKKNIESTVELLAKYCDRNGLIITDANLVDDSILREELENTESRENIEKVNKFLSDNKLRIDSDYKKVLRRLQTIGAPLAENEFGICISCIVQRVCEKRKYFSSIKDNYFIGIHLGDFKNINYSYERFKQKLDIVKHNEIVSMKHNEYLNEYQREVKALKYFTNKTLSVEIKFLEEAIKVKGIDVISREYNSLKPIIDKLDMIKKEVEEWTS